MDLVKLSFRSEHRAPIPKCKRDWMEAGVADHVWILEVVIALLAE